LIFSPVTGSGCVFAVTVLHQVLAGVVLHANIGAVESVAG